VSHRLPFSHPPAERGQAVGSGPLAQRDIAVSVPAGHDAGGSIEKGEDREDGMCVTLSAEQGGMMKWLPVLRKRS
jgi:hypothetical protein